MPSVLRPFAFAVLLLSLSACASSGGAGRPKEYLDESTAVTVITVDTPLVFARERRELAANARDYVTLAATAVNRAGKMDYLIVAYRWSTVDTRLETDHSGSTDVLVLSADDRRIELRSASGSARDFGIDKPVHPPPGPRHPPVVYRTDLASLRFIAASRQLSLQTGAGELAPRFDIWEDGRAALDGFVSSQGEVR